MFTRQFPAHLYHPQLLGGSKEKVQEREDATIHGDHSPSVHSYRFKKKKCKLRARYQWLIPVILATQG
jgi:hypothetical protein